MSFTFAVTEAGARVVARRGGPIALDFVPPIS
jgi:hypothetical protein